MGVAAFGSLDLIGALGDDADLRAAVDRFRENRIVDPPIEGHWYSLARAAESDPNSPFGGEIARAAAWRDVPRSFEQFQELIRSRSREMEPSVIASWAHLASIGLVSAVPALARQQVAAALLSWTMLSADPFFGAARANGAWSDENELPDGAGALTQMLLDIAIDLRDRFFREGAAIEPIASILADVLREAVGPAAASRVVAALVGKLDDETGRKVFTAYLQSANA